MPAERTRQSAQARASSSPWSTIIATPLRLFSKIRTTLFSEEPSSPSPTQRNAGTHTTVDGDGKGDGDGVTIAVKAASPRAEPSTSAAVGAAHSQGSALPQPYPPASAFRSPPQPSTPARSNQSSPSKSRSPLAQPSSAFSVPSRRSVVPGGPSLHAPRPSDLSGAPLIDLGGHTSDTERSSRHSGRPRTQAGLRAATRPSSYTPSARRTPAPPVTYPTVPPSILVSSSTSNTVASAPTSHRSANVTERGQLSESRNASTPHAIDLRDPISDPDRSSRNSGRQPTTQAGRRAAMSVSMPYASLRGRAVALPATVASTYTSGSTSTSAAALANESRPLASRLLYKTRRPGAPDRSGSVTPSSTLSSRDRYFIRAATQYAFGSSRYGIFNGPFPNAQASASDMPSFRESVAASQGSRKRPHSPKSSGSDRPSAPASNSPLRFGMNDDDVDDEVGASSTPSTNNNRPITPPGDNADKPPAPKRQRSLMVDAAVDPMSPPSKPTPSSKGTGPMSPERPAISKANASAQSTPTLASSRQDADLLTSPLKPVSLGAVASAAAAPPGPFGFVEQASLSFAAKCQDASEDSKQHDTTKAATPESETVKPAPFTFDTTSAALTPAPAKLAPPLATSTGFQFNLPGSSATPAPAFTPALTTKPAPASSAPTPAPTAAFTFAVPSTPASAASTETAAGNVTNPPQAKTPENQMAAQQEDDDIMIISPAPSKTVTPSPSTLFGEPLKAPPATLTFNAAATAPESASAAGSMAPSASAVAPFVFGNVVAATPVSAPSMFAFGNNAPASTATSSTSTIPPLFSFGNAGAITGTASTTSAPTTGAPAPFTFGASSSSAPSAPAAAPAPFTFGSAAAAPAAPPSGVSNDNSSTKPFSFNFGGSGASETTTSTAAPAVPAFAFGAGSGGSNTGTAPAAASGFEFTAPSNPPAFGTGAAQAPAQQQQQGGQPGGFTFSFASSNPAPTPSAPAPAAPFTFGQPNAAPPASGFGAAAGNGGQSASGFGGGAASGTPGFGFGAAAQQQQTPQPTGFNFGQSSAPSTMPAGGPPVTPRFGPPGAQFGGMSTPGFGAGTGVGGMATPGAGMFGGGAMSQQQQSQGPAGMPATPQGQGGLGLAASFDPTSAARKKYTRKPKK